MGMYSYYRLSVFGDLDVPTAIKLTQRLGRHGLYAHEDGTFHADQMKWYDHDEDVKQLSIEHPHLDFLLDRLYENPFSSNTYTLAASNGILSKRELIHGVDPNES